MLIRVHSTTTENAKMGHGGSRCEGQTEDDSHHEAGRLLLESDETHHAVSVPPSEELMSQTAALGTETLIACMYEKLEIGPAGCSKSPSNEAAGES